MKTITITNGNIEHYVTIDELVTVLPILALFNEELIILFQEKTISIGQLMLEYEMKASDETLKEFLIDYFIS